MCCYAENCGCGLGESLWVCFMIERDVGRPDRECILGERDPTIPWCLESGVVGSAKASFVTQFICDEMSVLCAE